jgi:hypothetical protein
MIMGPPGSKVVLNSNMNVTRTEYVKYMVLYCGEALMISKRSDFGRQSRSN